MFSSGQLDCEKIDLLLISKKTWNCIYNPKRFSALVIRLTERKGTVSYILSRLIYFLRENLHFGDLSQYQILKNSQKCWQLMYQNGLIKRLRLNSLKSPILMQKLI